MRATVLLLMVCLCCTMGPGCAKKNAGSSTAENLARTVSVDRSDGPGRSEAKEEPKVDRARVAPAGTLPPIRRHAARPGGRPAGGRPAGIHDLAEAAPAESAPIPVPSPAVAEAAVGRERAAPRVPRDDRLQSGILTAGSFDDNVEPLVFASFARRVSQNQALGDLPGKLQGHRLLVIVKDAAGKPVGNARVKLAAGTSAPV
jgi:hypothetical protein